MNAMDPSPVGLRAVLDYDQAMRTSDVYDARNLGRDAMEVNHDYGLCPRAHRCGDQPGIHAPCLELDIDKARESAEAPDGDCCRRGCDGRYEDFVLSTNLASIERERESIGAGIDTDDLGQTNIVTELGFEGFSLGTKNVASAGKDTGKRLVDLTAMSLKLEFGSGLGNEYH